MTERKNIDRLFQEKFKDFEVAPPDHVWENIEAELTKKKKRRVIPLWLQLTGIAAALILGFIVASKFIGKGDTNESGVVIEDKITPDKAKANEPTEEAVPGIPKAAPSGTNAPKIPEQVAASPEGNVGDQKKNDRTDRQDRISGYGSHNKAVANSSKGKKGNSVPPGKDKKSMLIELAGPADGVVTNNGAGSEQQQGQNNIVNRTDREIPQTAGISTENKAVASNVNSKTASPDSEAADNKASPESAAKDEIFKNTPDNQLATDDSVTIKDSAVVADVPNALEELSKEKEKEVTKTEQKINRWQITSNVAPIYFSSTSNGSPLDSRFATASKSYKPSVSYGMGVRYAAGKRFSFRAGVQTVQLEYSTNDIVFYQTPTARQIQNLRPNLQGSLIDIGTDPGEIALQEARSGNKFEGTLTQRTGYVEVPVELSYKILDRKFGIEMIGGFSTLFLSENEVSLQSEGMDMNIGQADNLNSTHFSTNIGLGFRYNFMKSFQANFEPVFKYQINTFSNDAGNFKPYFFGLYTGISYRF